MWAIWIRTALQRFSTWSPVSRGLGRPEKPGETRTPCRPLQGLHHRTPPHLLLRLPRGVRQCHRALPSPQMGFVCSHLCFYFLNELFSVGFLAASCTISCAGKLGLHPHRTQSAREGEPYQTGRLGLPRSPSATHLSPAHGCSPWLLWVYCVCPLVRIQPASPVSSIA